MFDDTERKKVQTYYTNLIQTKKTQLERTAAWDHFFGSKQKIMMEMLFNPVFQDSTYLIVPIALPHNLIFQLKFRLCTYFSLLGSGQKTQSH